MKWTVFYVDGSTYEGPPQDAPRQGVACIVQNDRILWKHDTYCWENGQWVEHDRYGCERYLDNEKFPIRLVGYCQTPDDWKATFARAKAHKRG